MRRRETIRVFGLPEAAARLGVIEEGAYAVSAVANDVAADVDDASGFLRIECHSQEEAAGGVAGLGVGHRDEYTVREWFGARP
jgi:anti-sigma factor RsiW